MTVAQLFPLSDIVYQYLHISGRSYPSTRACCFSQCMMSIKQNSECIIKLVACRSDFPPDPPDGKSRKLTLAQRREKRKQENRMVRQRLDEEKAEEQASEAKMEKEKTDREREEKDLQQARQLQDRINQEDMMKEAAAWEEEQLLHPVSNPGLLPRQGSPPPPKKMKFCKGCKTEIQRNMFIAHVRAHPKCAIKIGNSIADLRNEIRAESQRERYALRKEEEQARKRIEYRKNPEPKKAKMREEYQKDPEAKKDKVREKYQKDPEPKKVKRIENYEKQKANITSLDALKIYQLRSIHGPIFLCFFCAEYNFRSNVKRINLDQAKEEEWRHYMDGSHRLRKASYFKVLDSHWVCHSCREQVGNGKLPVTSTANILVDDTPIKFKDLSDVENCLIAPLIVFVKLHNLKNQLRNSRKIVACPVSTDKVFENLRRLHSELSIATLIRSAEFDQNMYSGQVRPSLIRDCIHYLLSRGYRHYGDHNQAESLARKISNIDLTSKVTQSPDIDDDNDISWQSDAVERQRVKLDCVATAFLPDEFSKKFAPAEGASVANMTEIRDPYSQMFPPRFPSGYDIHSPYFIRPVTESEWVNHKIRGIDPWFSQNPLFVFTAAYRLDFQKTASSLHALKGKVIKSYKFSTFSTVSSSGVPTHGRGQQAIYVEQAEKHLHFRKIPGTSHFYAKHKANLEAKVSALKQPMFFFTLTNRTKGVHLATAVSQQGIDVFHRSDELKMLNENPQAEEILFTGEEREYFVHTKSILRRSATDICAIHVNCTRTPLADFMPENQKRSTVSNSLYNINKMYNDNEKNILQNIMIANSNPLKIGYYHVIKEFGESSGWCHSHGLGWRKIFQDEVSEIHRQMLDATGGALTDNQLSRFAEFCNTVVSVSLDPSRIVVHFPDMSQQRANDVTTIAEEVNVHGCTRKCLREWFEGCWYRYPRCPSTYTIISRPPAIKDRKMKQRFIEKTEAIKDKVKEEIEILKTNGTLESTSLIDLLTMALGDIDEAIHDDTLRYFTVAGQEFQEDAKLREFIFNSTYEDDAAVLHGLYTYCLTFDKVHRLVIQRQVAEAYVVQYQPHILEASRANHSMEVITHTLDTVIDYITKRRGNSLDEAKKLAQDLDNLGHKEKSAHILKTAVDHREVTQSEAYFRIDPSLSMASTNLQVVFVNSKFPANRSRTYQRVGDDENEEATVTIDGKAGKFKARENILDKYQYLPDILNLLILMQFAMNYNLGTPAQQAKLREKYNSQDKIPKSKVLMAVTNDEKHGEDIFLPSSILLQNGCFMTMNKKPVIVEVPHLTTEHEKEYSDLLLYTPWSSEENELGDALTDMVVCSNMHARMDKNPKIGLDGRMMTNIETVRSRLNTPSSSGINKLHLLIDKTLYPQDGMSELGIH